MGRQSYATADFATAIGNIATASAIDTIAFGNASQASAVAAVAVGKGAVASIANGVALGSGSVTSAILTTDVGYLTTQVAPTIGSVSVGGGTAATNRRIQNVADGSADSDAVTVAQLKVVNNTAATHKPQRIQL